MLNLIRKRAAGSNGHAVKAVEDEIAATRQAGLDALSEAERLEAAGAAELDDEPAEELLRQARAQRRASMRADVRLTSLREELAAVKWERDQGAALARIADARRLGREMKEAVQKAGAAVSAYVANRELAMTQLGGNAERLIPQLAYCGIVHSSFTQPWCIEAERTLAALDHAELPKPVPPPVPRLVASDKPKRLPPTVSDANRPARWPSWAPPLKSQKPKITDSQRTVYAGISDRPITPAAPKRQLRRDPPPGAGEVQLHILRGGVELPDGEPSRIGDIVTMPEAAGRDLVERGAADFHEAAE
jgi:hypothetical protein